MQDILRKKLWAVGGGKGGANLHLLFGIRYPLYTLGDFISHQTESLEDVLLPTSIDNLKLLCGADDILGIANPKYGQKIRLLGHLRRLNADIILLDLGAGTSFTTMDFFLYAGRKIVVLTPQVTSIQNAYGFIKSCLHRKLVRSFATDPEALEIIRRAIGSEGSEKMEFMTELKHAFKEMGTLRCQRLEACFADMQAGIVVNMLRDPKEQEVGRIIQEVSQKYLDLALKPMGFVPYDVQLGRSINNMADFLEKGSGSPANMAVYDIAAKVLKQSRSQQPAETPPDTQPMYAGMQV